MHRFIIKCVDFALFHSFVFDTEIRTPHAHLTLSRGENHVSGTFRANARSAASGATVRFTLVDGEETGQLTLKGENDRNLLHFKWAHRPMGEIVLLEHSVLGKDFEVSNRSQPDPVEADAFSRLHETKGYRALPLLSHELGLLGLTGWRKDSAFALHKLALDAENTHRSLARSQRVRRGMGWDDYTWIAHARRQPHHHPNHRSRFHQKRVPLSNPFGKKNTFPCSATNGRCDKRLLDYTKESQCKYRGEPIPQSDYKNDCPGMCGPACYNCW